MNSHPTTDQTGPAPEFPRNLALMALSSSDVTFEGSNEGVTTWVSPGVEALLGWKPIEIVGTPFSDLVRPDMLPVLARIQSDVLAGREGRGRLPVRRADGDWQWIDLLVKPVVDDEERVTGRYGSWHDAQEQVHAEEELRRAAWLRDTMFAAALDPVVVFKAIRDVTGRIVDFEYTDANAAACQYNQVAREDLIGMRLLDLLPAHAATHLIHEYAAVVETGQPLDLDDYAYPREVFAGQERFYDIRAVKLGDGLFYTWRDVTDRHEQADLLARSEARYRLLAENAADVVLLIKDGLIDWISPSVEQEFGAPASEWIGRPARDLVNPADLDLLRGVMAGVMEGREATVRARGVSPRGVQHWVEAHAKPYIEGDGQITGLITTYRVIDETIESEAELERRARFDDLTGLLNRSEILRRVTQVTLRTARSGDETAALFCDIDRFKDINDEHGHAAGDEVLRTLGERINAAIRTDDYAARIGGDELLIMLPGVHSLAEAAELAEKIRDIASQRVALERGVGIFPQMSIGVTLLRSGETTDQLVERADNAMYLAKKAGRNRVVAI